MAGLTDDEKEQIRYHLGYMETSYGSTQAAASIQLGIPRPTQTVFLLEQAMTMLTNPYALERCRCILQTIAGIEAQMKTSLAQLGVESIGDIKMRGSKRGETVTDMLEREYGRWAKRLGDLLGVPLYGFSARFGNASGAGNIPVRH